MSPETTPWRAPSHRWRLADQLVGDQSGRDEAERLVGEQQRQVPLDDHERGQLKQDAEQHDRGEQPLAVQDDDPLQQLGEPKVTTVITTMTTACRWSSMSAKRQPARA